ncbi:MAG: DegT/DnrJ/EryC1/StrS family aminotransferase [Planctomycetes bacterium]|nr:DegT/DnrJ/EryC1/StrS family aminotransferase [Planctomycetota bacterium]
MGIPTKDYGRQHRALWGELAGELERCLLGDDPILGAAVEAFERELAAYHGVAHAVGVNCGTDAIVMALRGLGVRDGDEVVTSAHTFSGVVSAIVQAGGVPRLVEPERDTLVVTRESLQAACTPRTRALLPVHLYGQPIDLAGLRDWCTARGLALLEDGAQAHGARSGGRSVGSFGHAAATSFHPSKNLGAFGDGGAILTDDANLAATLRIARHLGKDGKYEMVAIGPNSKLDTLQAALLRVKLRHLDEWVARRAALAERYQRGLAGVGDLVLPAVPDASSGARHAWHLYVVRTARRDALRAFLAERAIKTGMHYPIAAHEQPALRDRCRGGPFPFAAELARTVVSLPLSQELTEAEIDAVIDAVRRFFAAKP